MADNVIKYYLVEIGAMDIIYVDRLGSHHSDIHFGITLKYEDVGEEQKIKQAIPVSASSNVIDEVANFLMRPDHKAMRDFENESARCRATVAAKKDIISVLDGIEKDVAEKGLPWLVEFRTEYTEEDRISAFFFRRPSAETMLNALINRYTPAAIPK